MRLSSLYRLIPAIFAFFLLAPQGAYCQNILQKSERDSISTGEDKTFLELLKYDGGSFLGGVGYGLSRPVYWKGDDWLKLGGTLAGTLLLYTVDEETSEFFQRQRDGVPKIIRDYGWYYGSPQNNYMILGAAYITSAAIKSEKWRRTTILMLSSASAAGIVQQIAKTIAGRARPGEGRKPNDFRPFNDSAGYHSFPSGHTVLAVTNAYALAKHFDNPWIKTGIYTIGAIPPISRLWEGDHWLSDVMLSVVLSIATVESIDHYLDRRYSNLHSDAINPMNKKISWNVRFGARSIGITGTF
ncbi:MAG: phosphatase PAP2 family protein [Leeuwenhoekiella sp.]